MSGKKQIDEVVTVSTCIIALNEEQFLPQLLNDLLNQTYSKELTEVVLVDACSTDSTIEIMKRFAQDHESDYLAVKVLSNEKKTQASGWNVAIRASSCDVIIRIDAHATIAHNFVEANMRVLNEGEYVCGGVTSRIIRDESWWGNLLLQVENSPLGCGVGAGRSGTSKKYVDSLFLPAYRREVFDKAGLFDESLSRTEDNEMSHRLGKCGYKFRFDASIISSQYARGTFSGLMKQMYSNGYSVGKTAFTHPGSVSLFHFAPLLFVISLFASILLVPITWIPLAALAIFYFLAGIANTVIIIKRQRFLLSYLMVPAIMFCIHLSYGCGSIVGILDLLWHKS